MFTMHYGGIYRQTTKLRAKSKNSISERCAFFPVRMLRGADVGLFLKGAFPDAMDDSHYISRI